ncbi:indole-3-glycerol phosphate synthase-domain-containing protein [Pelagophyceae sp. CCMP2097]|nr:indole-3-glycerol phosphate synthase-domain-containing protein [Pelagophyceae sp. CCMP2097]
MRLLAWAFAVAVAESFRVCSAPRRFPRGVSQAARPDTAHLLGDGDAAHVPSTLQKIAAKCHARALESAAVGGSREALLARISEIDAELGGPLDVVERVGLQGLSIAAEFKRASPSKGKIAKEGASAAAAALEYANAGAAVISILTEPEWFEGSLADLEAARRAVNSLKERPALLRKDFVTHPHMVLEARASGADSLLLIVACLGVNDLAALIGDCRVAGIEPLVEVHTEEEMLIALEVGSKCIGINNRNLHTFQLDMSTTARLARIARDWESASGSAPAVICSLSGVSSRADVAELVDGGLRVSCVLVGEALMRSADPKAAIKALLEGTDDEKTDESRPLAKVCGVTSVEDALAAAQGGADLIGVIFAERSKRKVDTETAKAIVDAVRAYGERKTRWAPALFDAEPTADWRSSLAAWAAALRKDTSRGRPLVVGVFQDQPLAEVQAAVSASGVDLVQLHGDEPRAYADALPVPHLRVLHADVAEADAAATAAGLLRSCDSYVGGAKACCGVLVDAAKAGERGGVGERFDWTIAKALAAAELRPLLAGGLAAIDVQQAKAMLGADVLGYDASSKLESAPRVKDNDAVRAYCAAVRS